MDGITLARAVHVLAVIHWIGGVAFVTMVILPSASPIATAAARLALFEAIEHRFSRQVRVSVPLAGASGLYMVDRLDLWHRFIEPTGWWLMAMAVVWLLFMAVLFVLEPFVLRGWFRHRALADPARALADVQRAHWILLCASAATAGAAVLGAHGYFG
jgi:uncharacterized membrane protein